MSEDEILRFEVDDVDVGSRADKYLSVMSTGLSRARLQSLIADGHVNLNGEVFSTASRKVEDGDIFEVRVPPLEEAKPKAENIPLDIVYEDDDVLVINKPAGMVVHPGAGNYSGTLVNALLYHCAGSLSGIGGVARPGIVHRLDKDTGGLMMVAKNDHAHHSLSEQLSDRSLSRVYHALVVGVPMPIKGSVDRAIGRDRSNRLKMSVMGQVLKEARTHYHVLHNYREACALVECRLETGRTHQIRVHMDSIGRSLVGDTLYGYQPNKLISKLKKANYDDDLIGLIGGFERQFLHAVAIRFVHPTTGDEMAFETQLPEGMSNILNLLEK